MKMHFSTLASVAFISLGVSTSSAQEGAVDFEKQILPLLKEKCFKCHEKEHEENGPVSTPGRLSLLRA